MVVHRLALALTLSISLAASGLTAARAFAPAPENWPGFRGPGGDGVAGDADLPVRWSKTENVAWVTEVAGRGWSSPIVWDGRVYVTSAIGAKPFKQPTPGLYGNDYIAEMQAQGLPRDEISRRVRARDNEIPEESDEIRYMVYALDAATGSLVWERQAHKSLPSGGRHRKNTYASETPVTDGERLYVSFGQNIGLFALTLDGEPVWSKTWPAQPIYLDFGTASSPVVHDGKVLLLQDSERESYLTALDAGTGEELWRAARPRGRSFPLQSSWSTPFVWTHGGRTEIVTTGHGMIASYGLDGTELWRIRNTTMPTPSPFASGGLLYVGTGAQGGDASRPFFAIRPGAAGDITPEADETSNDFVAWMQPRAAGYTPSGIVYDNRAYLVHDTGVMGVYDAATGRELYKARVGGVGHTFSASPIVASGRIYFPDEDGVTVVVKAGAQYEEIAQNDLGEMMLASPAVSGNALFIRTETKLYRIGSSMIGSSGNR